MSAWEKFNLAILAMLFMAAVVKAILWATEPRRDTLMDHYDRQERGLE